MVHTTLGALLGFSLPENCRSEAESALARHTWRAGRVILPGILVFQTIMLLFTALREGGPFFFPRRSVYFCLYLILFCVTLAFLLAAFFLNRRGRSPAAVLRLGAAYAALLSLWGCAVTITDQYGGNGLNVYIYVLLSLAMLPALRPWQSAAIFGASCVVLNCLLPLSPSGRSNQYNNLVNSVFIALLSFFLSAYLYRSRICSALDRATIQRQCAELSAANLRLSELAATDQLTGLHNRRYLEEVAAPRLCQGGSLDCPAAGLMVDIDFFKQYNDAYGHQAGDLCLQRIARLVQESAGRDACVVRYGGEEFFLCLFGPDSALAREAAERIRAGVEALDLPHSSVPAGRVTISIGLCIPTPGAPLAMEELVHRSDQALYRAKRSGRNRVNVYEDPPADAGPQPL